MTYLITWIVVSSRGYLDHKKDHSSSPEDIYFDTVVGALQDIIFDEQFEGMQRPFMTKYCPLF